MPFNIKKKYKEIKDKIKKFFKKYWKQSLIFGLILFFLLLFSFGLAMFFKSKDSQNYPYTEFLGEIYDKIKDNYWEKISDQQLSELFELGIEKLVNAPQTLEEQNKEGVKKKVLEIIKKSDQQKKKEFTVYLSSLVLANLKPFGRSSLYTMKDEANLKNLVQNIDSNVNLYQSLGIDKDSSPEEIAKAYENKASQIKKEESPEANQKIQELERAYETLSAPESKETYDQYGIEATVIGKLVKPTVAYIQIKKISPTTFDELYKVTENIKDKEGLSSLILDLRGNIGGSIDILPYLLGPFIGQGQYAYEFFHQGDYAPYKTMTGWFPGLVKYKKVVILIDENTQSSAEVMAAVFKKYNVGILVGTKTKGWGTIEKVFEISRQIDPEEKYSMFLVHTLTLSDDNQPIEGKGVEPVINIKDPDWKNQLFAYFNYKQLVDAVEELF
ncbi:MAG: S41 family peptidase [bacterium]|nr:S41 family peptidase [bacterium]